MNELKLELTKEQEEAMQKLASSIMEFCEKVWNELKKIFEGIAKVLEEIAEAFRIYIMSLQPKQRYKFLKAMGIKEYVGYFRRSGIIRCRNNC